jgi:hypothetical protein
MSACLGSPNRAGRGRIGIRADGACDPGGHSSSGSPSPSRSAKHSWRSTPVPLKSWRPFHLVLVLGQHGRPHVASPDSPCTRSWWHRRCCRALVDRGLWIRAQRACARRASARRPRRRSRRSSPGHRAPTLKMTLRLSDSGVRVGLIWPGTPSKRKPRRWRSCTNSPSLESCRRRASCSGAASTCPRPGYMPSGRDTDSPRRPSGSGRGDAADGSPGRGTRHHRQSPSHDAADGATAKSPQRPRAGRG